uniref:3-ketodihydrosphingosine reductase n=1 Tax=Mesocestoides corti TaxID=53468 RepID=A0A5K3FQS7_MESCO
MILAISGAVVLAYLVRWWVSQRPREVTLEGRHVLITGGSSGIGLALAAEALRRRAGRVTLVARDATRLADSRRKLIEAFGADCDVRTVSLDIAGSFDVIQESLLVTHKVGTVDVLINCAGMSVARTFEECAPDAFERQMRINYLGGVHVTKALLPAMLGDADACQRRRIAFVSSLAGLISIYGFAGYAASKAAVGAFASVLQQELEDCGPAVTVVFPPDTDTPGLKTENVGKPAITSAISDAGGLYSPEEVASNAMRDILAGRRRSLLGVTGHALSWATAGVSRPQEAFLLPLPPLLAAGLEVLLAPLFKVALMGFAYWCRLCILRHRRLEKPERQC